MKYSFGELYCNTIGNDILGNHDLPDNARSFKTIDEKVGEETVKSVRLITELVEGG